jgi:hypothetical protein
MDIVYSKLRQKKRFDLNQTFLWEMRDCLLPRVFESERTPDIPIEIGTLEPTIEIQLVR